LLGADGSLRIKPLLAIVPLACVWGAVLLWWAVMLWWRRQEALTKEEFVNVDVDPHQPLPHTEAEHQGRSQASSAAWSTPLSVEVVSALKYGKVATPDSATVVHKSVSECGYTNLPTTPQLHQMHHNIVAALTAYDENMHVKQCIQSDNHISTVFRASIHGKDMLATLLKVLSPFNTPP